MKLANRSFSAYAVVAALTLVVFLATGYFELMQSRPTGAHVWRQTDSASFLLSYYTDNADLLEPRFHFQMAGSGKTVGEFPGLYFFVAQIYKVTGPKEWIARLVYLIIYLIGLMYAYRIARLIIKDIWLAILPMMLLLTSPVILFYSCSFIPDVPALSFLLAAWFYLLLFLEKEKKAYLIGTIIGMTIAGLLKATMLIHLGLMSLMILLKYFDAKSPMQVFKKLNLWWGAVSMIIPALIGWVWIQYAASYNEENGTLHFLMQIKPFWMVPGSELKMVTERLITSWSLFAFSPIIYLLTIICLGIVIWKWKSLKGIWLWCGLGSLTISIVLLLLFYPQFYHHDYYIIQLSLGVFFLVCVGLSVLRNQINLRKHFREIGLTTLLVIMIGHAGYFLRDKYLGDHFAHGLDDYYTLEPFLEEHEIGYDKLIYSPSDITSNATLYFMNRKGWTNYYFGDYDYRFEGDWVNVMESIGADYMVVNGSGHLTDTVFIQANKSLVGKHEDLYIYDLQSK